MIVNHNIVAMNTFNHYTLNQKRVTGSLSKLSSGFRIVSAADDSAGLAISEKMRARSGAFTRPPGTRRTVLALYRRLKAA